MFKKRVFSEEHRKHLSESFMKSEARLKASEKRKGVSLSAEHRKFVGAY